MLAALRSEQAKFRNDKSTTFVVLWVAKELRKVEIKMASTTFQRLVVLDNHLAIVKALEREVVDKVRAGSLKPLDEFQARIWREEAELDFKRGLGEYLEEEKRAFRELNKRRRAPTSARYYLMYPTMPPRSISK